VSAGNIVFTCRDGGGNPLFYVVSTAGAFRGSASPLGTGTTTAPAVVGGNVYTLLGGQVESRSYSGFYQKWAVTPPFSVFTDALAGDGIVVTCGSGGIFVVNATDGSTRFSNTSAPCAADPTIANGVIYEPSSGNVVMFDEFGDLLGRLGTGAAAGPPAVVDGSVYAAESISGVDRWAIPPPATTARVRAHGRPNPRRLHPNRALKQYRRHHRAQ
jgi:hypothetical protein